MHVERFGHGPVELLCLHGWSGDHRTFEPLAHLIPDGYSLLCPDLPGCGRSAAPENWSAEAIVEALAPWHRPRMIGNCSGAIFALLLAQRRPVEWITMIDAFAYWPWYFRLFLAPGWGRHAYGAAFANPVGRRIADLSLAKHRAASTSLTEGFAGVDHKMTYRYLQLLAEIGPPEQFRGVDAAIRIVHGARTFAAIRRSAAIWKSIFPAAQESELKGAGHLPILEAAPALSRIIFREPACQQPSTLSVN